MRPGQNKRMRGRNNNHGRKGPNPLTRSFESNGPDVKIRGTAQHIAEKYLQLARDSQTSGDPVMAENYLQHAEHYYRVITTAQQAQQQALSLNGRPAPEVEEEDDGGEEDDRFASVADRLPQPPPPPQPVYQAQPQGGQQQPYQGQPNGGGQQYGERQPYQGQRPWRDNRNDNRGDNRNDSRGDNRQDRGGEPRADNRQDGGRPENGERQDRQGQSGAQPWRNDGRRGPRNEQAEAVADSGAALPAFITRPVEGATPAVPAEQNLSGPDGAEGQGYHLRPRRRRRGRPDGAADQEFGEAEASPNEDSVPVSE